MYMMLVMYRTIQQSHLFAPDYKSYALICSGL